MNAYFVFAHKLSKELCLFCTHHLSWIWILGTLMNSRQMCFYICLCFSLSDSVSFQTSPCVFQTIALVSLCGYFVWFHKYHVMEKENVTNIGHKTMGLRLYMSALLQYYIFTNSVLKNPKCQYFVSIVYTCTTVCFSEWSLQINHTKPAEKLGWVWRREIGAAGGVGTVEGFPE